MPLISALGQRGGAVRIATTIAILALATSALAGVSVKPASRRAEESARNILRDAFRSPRALRKAHIAGEVVLLGPRLWASTAEARKPFGDAVKDTYAIVSVPGVVERWSLRPLDLMTVSASTRSTFGEMAKTGTLVPEGAIIHRIAEILSALVLERVPERAFHFRLRRPTGDEVLYYWALVPYELRDPILVLESDQRSFLCDFHDGTLSFFEEL
jgi:hypothetical protein